MSFWTGFTEGLAGSLDRGLQSIMTKRDNELSAAKKFWREREISKMEKKEAEKEAYDKEASKAFTFLLEGFGGDETKAKAALDLLIKTGGGIGGATKYMQGVQEVIGTKGLSGLQEYDISRDFRNYEAGDTPYTGGIEGIKMKGYEGTSFDPVKYGVAKTSPFDRFLGKEGPSADVIRAMEQSKQMFGTGRPDDAPVPAASTARFSGVDRSRFLAARTERERLEDRGLDLQAKKIGLERVELDMDATALGMTRTRQAMSLDAQAAALAQDKFASAEKQQEIQNKRAEAEALRRQAELIMKAEKHVVDMEAANLTVEEKKREAEKAKRHPEFTSFERAVVYAQTQLARSDLTDVEREDFKKLSDDMTAAALAYNNEVKNKGGTAIKFSPATLNSIVKAAQDFELKGLPTKSIGDTVEYIVEGNEAEYYAGMSRAFSAIRARLTPEGEDAMPLEAERYVNQLQKNLQERAFEMADARKLKYDNASPAERKNIKYVPMNEVAGAVNTIMSRSTNPQLTRSQALIQYGIAELPKGAIIPIKPDLSVYGIWTGTRFVEAKK